MRKQDTNIMKRSVPYVEEVTIKQGGDLVYNARWIEDKKNVGKGF